MAAYQVSRVTVRVAHYLDDLEYQTQKEKKEKGWVGEKKQLEGSITIKPEFTVQVKSVAPKRGVDKIDPLSVRPSNRT
jgi:hypothetical protein